MSQSNASRLSVSTWSLHRALGVTFADAPGQESRARQETFGPGSLSLLEVPERIAAMGIRTLEICHFQIPSRDAAYLNELRSAIRQAGVRLLSVLVDNGDITDPQHSERDKKWVAGWIETAGELGAERARVIAGKAEYSDEAFALSLHNMAYLAAKGSDCGVRVTTENWFPLLSRPETVLLLLDSLEGEAGLNLDFGNWSGPTKYDDLAAIFPVAESCHAKCAFRGPQQPDEADYRRCLELAREAGFTGPYTLIYDDQDNDEWSALAWERDMVKNYL